MIEDHATGDIFACLPDGADRAIKTDGCIKVLPVNDRSARPAGFRFAGNGMTAHVNIQHSDDTNMAKVDDYATDDLIRITGFQIPAT